MQPHLIVILAMVFLLFGGVALVNYLVIGHS
jgi:hypothetical protein